MKPKLVTTLAIMGLCVAGFAGYAGAEGLSTTTVETTTASTTTGTTTEIQPPPPVCPPDMPLGTFKERRVAKKQHVNRIRYSKGYRRVHFRHTHREIRQCQRQENLSYWTDRVDRARHAPRVGAYGHRWRWYEGNPYRKWGFYERAADVMVRRVFGAGVASWTISCSRSEGHGMMVWNGGYFDPGRRYGEGPGPGGISTAYGPMQFMHSTLSGNVDGAFYMARHRGFRGLPNRYKRWNSNIAQALTAGYMFWKGGNPGTWTGASC